MPKLDQTSSSEGTCLAIIRRDLRNLQWGCLIFLPVAQHERKTAAMLCNKMLQIHAGAHHDDTVNPTTDEPLQVVSPKSVVVVGVAKEHLIILQLCLALHFLGDLRIVRIGNYRQNQGKGHGL